MRKQRRKLGLRSETLRALDHRQLARVAGGSTLYEDDGDGDGDNTGLIKWPDMDFTGASLSGSRKC